MVSCFQKCRTSRRKPANEYPSKARSPHCNINRYCLEIRYQQNFLECGIWLRRNVSGFEQTSVYLNQSAH